MEEEYIFNYNLNNENVLWTGKQNKLAVVFKYMWIEIVLSIIIFILLSIILNVLVAVAAIAVLVVGGIVFYRIKSKGNPTKLQYIVYDLSYRYIVTDVAIHIYSEGGHNDIDYKSFDYVEVSRSILDYILGTATIKIMIREQEEKRNGEALDSADMFKTNNDKIGAKLLCVKDYKQAIDIIRRQNIM